MFFQNHIDNPESCDQGGENISSDDFVKFKQFRGVGKKDKRDDNKHKIQAKADSFLREDHGDKFTMIGILVGFGVKMDGHAEKGN